MNIFYLNPKLPTGAPFDNIEIGDICFLQIADAMVVWVQDNETKRKIETGKVEFRYIQKNVSPIKPIWPRVFSFDGIKKRKGDRLALQLIQQLIDEPSIKALLTNAIRILEYKEDTLDAANYMHLLGMDKATVDLSTQSVVKEEVKKPEVVKKPDKPKGIIKQPPVDTPPEPNDTTTSTNNSTMSHSPLKYIFYGYLDSQSQEMWNYFHKKGLAIRDIFTKIKANHKINFSSALRKFNDEHPTQNIYSLKEQKQPKPVPAKQPTFVREPGFDFIYDGLEERGYVQISNKMWKDKNGKIYVINIHQN